MRKCIDWNTRSEEERNYYDYYLSLGYSEQTAAVLALFTYGEKRYKGLTIDTLYRLITEQKRNIDRYADRNNNRMGAPLLMSSVTGMLSSRSPAKAAARENIICKSTARSASENKVRRGMSTVLEDTDESAGSCLFITAGVGAGKSFSMGGSLQKTPVMETDEYDPVEEKDFRNTADSMTSTFRMTTNTASAGVIFNQLRNNRRIDTSMVRIEEMLNYFRYKSEKPVSEKFKISHELKGLNGAKRLLYINVQGCEDVKNRQNIVILLDVSGSMSSNAKKTQAIAATIISKLNPGDKLSLVTYSSDDEVVFRGRSVRKKTKSKHLKPSSVFRSAAVRMAPPESRRLMRSEKKNISTAATIR